MALLLPSAYYSIAHNYRVGSMETELAMTASTVSQEITRNPELWRYAQVRLEEMISRRTQGGAGGALRIYDEKGDLVAERKGLESSPVLVRTYQLKDSGIAVGMIEIRTSLRPLLINTAIVALIGSALGLMVFLSLRILPLRAIYQAEDSLRKSRDEMEARVAERTAELTSSNQNLLAEIEARKTAEEQLLHDAFHDGLTGLPNRALFMDRLTRAIAIARRRKEYLFAVLFLDLDRFKVVNDSLGHIVGDKLLVALGERLVTCLRPGDTVARLGGDEFVVLLEDMVAAENAVMIAGRIDQELKTPFILAGHEVFASGSIGIALSASSYEKAEQVLRDADTAMYQAKTRGRAQYALFEPGMHAEAMKRLQLESDLRRALERKEFMTYYQPILSVKTNTVIGCEALVRWQHPERGIVFPGDFIQVAEETGLLVAIDRLVLWDACVQLQDWLAQLPANAERFVSVNLSNKQLARPDLLKHVAGALKTTGLPPAMLKLEITETAIIENPEATAEMLAQLRALGVRLYIDDFGTGYSSLSYLYRLPIDGLKIDRSFIKRMGEKGENQEIIKTILALAKDLGLDVIAEGVETKQQLSQIDALNCESWQGYLFSKPVASGEAARMLLEQHTLPR